MQQVEITDIPFDAKLNDCQYDWFVFGVGVESRTEFVLDRLSQKKIIAERTLVLMFPDVAETPRGDLIINKISKTFQKVEVKIVETNSQVAIWKLLRTYFLEKRGTKILVDYSSMSRAWYAAMLFWFWENSNSHADLRLDFLYAEGKYTKEIAEKDVVIKDIEIVPGCVGAMFRHAKTVTVFGLGFYGYMSLCACEQVEPDILYTFSTIENPIEDFVIEERAGNRELVERAAKSFRLSVCSVASAYRCLSEIATVHLNRGDEVILAPMGPKPHVLASILVSLANRNVCTLRVRHEKYVSDVKPSGRIILTRVKFVSVDF